jgi:Rod binding domain-containing protein
MAIPPISAASALNFTGVASTHRVDSPEKIKDAASQFEGLMISQILKASHGDSDEGAFGGEADPASASAMDFANEYFARAMAAKGGLGLSKMIVAGLQKHAVTIPDASTETQAPAAPEQ